MVRQKQQTWLDTYVMRVHRDRSWLNKNLKSDLYILSAYRRSRPDHCDTRTAGRHCCEANQEASRSTLACVCEQQAAPRSGLRHVSQNEAVPESPSLALSHERGALLLQHNPAHRPATRSGARGYHLRAAVIISGRCAKQGTDRGDGIRGARDRDLAMVGRGRKHAHTRTHHSPLRESPLALSLSLRYFRYRLSLSLPRHTLFEVTGRREWLLCFVCLVAFPTKGEPSAQTRGTRPPGTPGADRGVTQLLFAPSSCSGKSN